MSEVYIDGVNVAGCEFLDDISLQCVLNKYFIAIINPKKCSNNPDCYFKQLQRAKAEMQEKVLKMAEAEVEIEKLQTENEKLNEKYLASLRDNAINTELKLINDNLKAENENLKKENKELKGIIALLNIQYTYLPYVLREKIKSLSP